MHRVPAGGCAVKDMFGVEITEEQALAMKKQKRPTSRKAMVAARQARGVHPHNGLPLLAASGHTCGDCGHKREDLGGYSRHWYKCALTPGGGPATDIRVRWPACVKWIVP